MKTEFTGKEEAVLFHLYHSMKGNGFDFGLVDEVRPAGIAAKQARSVMRALRKKLCIDTDPKFWSSDMRLEKRQNGTASRYIIQAMVEGH